MAEFIVPDWPAPANVRALQTTRHGGISAAPWDDFNLGDHVGDEVQAVQANRARLRAVLPAEPVWLRQVHGTLAVDAAKTPNPVEADAAWTERPAVVCAVMTADCLPLLVCDRHGRRVAAIHAGWRGLAGGVVEATVAAMGVASTELLVWLGPAIGPGAFEVGGEVRAAFVADDAAAADAFAPTAGDKWLADLYALARCRLRRLGVTQVFGGERCTFSEPDTFFSYRRDGITGRMASLIWLEAGAGGV